MNIGTLQPTILFIDLFIEFINVSSFFHVTAPVGQEAHHGFPT